MSVYSFGEPLWKCALLFSSLSWTIIWYTRKSLHTMALWMISNLNELIVCSYLGVVMYSAECHRRHLFPYWCCRTCTTLCTLTYLNLWMLTARRLSGQDLFTSSFFIHKSGEGLVWPFVSSWEGVTHCLTVSSWETLRMWGCRQGCFWHLANGLHAAISLFGFVPLSPAQKSMGKSVTHVTRW